MVASTIRAVALAIVLLAPIGASAQTSTPPPAKADLLKPEQLDQLVAPVALYPDTLLSLVLIASTFPTEVVQAERWLTAHKDLKGEKLKVAVDKEDWDESVKSLVATPDVLGMMSAKLDWTEKLGDAVLAQEADVMDAIQRLRAKADANSKLTSTKEQRVTRKQVEGGREVIVIEPTDPNTVYVPYYDPAVVYGAWPYPEYPPYYFPPPGYIAAGVIATGIAFGAGYALARWATGRYLWGGGVNWGRNNLVVNRPVNVNAAGTTWNRNARAQRRENQAGRREQLRTERGARQGERQTGREERRTERHTGRGERQTERQAGRGERQGQRETRRGERQAGRPSGRPSVEHRPSRGASGVQHRAAGANRGAAGAHRAAAAHRGGGAHRAAAAHRGGGGSGGGRRSDIRLKHDIVFLGRLPNGVGFYRFSYNGSAKAYVGVMAQEVQQVVPDAVARGRDGYLMVYYDKLGLTFQTYDQWLGSGARIPRRIQFEH
jgi:Protein of unknown function (DUF3300)/Chaperone of endosialidase